jgi:3-oxoacyl-[acyl-carrier-protein] synthase III
MGAKIKNIEFITPSIKLTNDDLKNEFKDYNFKRFESRVGISQRYIAAQGETTLSLAEKACEKLLNNSDLEAKDVNYVIFCTQSPEYKLPTTACILQDRLGLNQDVGAFDFNLGCSGYVYGLFLAKKMVCKEKKNLILVTSETYSKLLHPEDRSNRSIFGDAASATWIQYSDSEFIKNFVLGTDGRGFDKLIVKNGGDKFPFNFSPKKLTYGTNNNYSENNLYMDGPAIYDFTSKKVPKIIIDTLEVNGINKDEIDQFILHQANKILLNQIRVSAEIQNDKFYINLAKYGNTVSNTIPIALKEYLDENNTSKTNKIILTGFGVGLSWASCLVKIET